MSKLKSLSIFVLILIYSRGNKPEKHIVDASAVQLNIKAMELVPFIDNGDSSIKAVSLLDDATKIDSNYFLGYYNKLMFLNQLQQFDKAILTVNKLIQLRPRAHDLYMTGGILYERLADTVSSQSYFQESLTICTSVLDTMSNKNSDYEMFVTNKAINLIMLSKIAEANRVLKVLYDSLLDDPEYENINKKWIQSLMNKNKAELMETFTNPEKYNH